MVTEVLRDDRSGLFYRPTSNDLGIIAEVRRYHADWPIRAGDVVLDLGAHIGAATIRALELGAAFVVAVEPEPRNYELLLRNIAGRHLRVLPIQAAVSTEDGRVFLYRQAEQGPQASHSIVTKGRKEPMLVRAIAFRSLLNDYQPDVVKCDIEQGEYVIAAELAHLPSFVRVLAMEVHFGPRQAGLDLIASIEAQGFKSIQEYHVSPKAWHVNICWTRE